MIPINPCGAVCDWGRRPYRTRCRFGDSDSLVADIRWYIADHDADALPFPSAFLNDDWEDNDAERDYGFEGHIGEVRGEPKVTDFKDQPQGHTGAHQCGLPEWYRSGVPVDPTRPPTIYNADGIPVCCAPGRGIMWGKPPLVPRGGLAWGGGGEVIHGSDSCPTAPLLTPGVVYTQPPEIMGPVGNGLWFDLGLLGSGTSGLEVIDLGGLNAVASVRFRTGSSCGSSSEVGAAIVPPFVIDTSGWDGFHGWAIVIPATLGAGTISPTFTIQAT